MSHSYAGIVDTDSTGDDDNDVKSKSKSKCQVCFEHTAQYTCPRCIVRYCSVECYRTHSTTCTEAFYQKNVEDSLSQMRMKMKTMQQLKRFEEEQAEMDENLQLQSSSVGGDGGEEDEEEKLANHKAILLRLSELDTEDLTLEQLPPELRSKFQRDVANGAVSGAVVEPWLAWWRNAADIIEVQNEGGGEGDAAHTVSVSTESQSQFSGLVAKLREKERKMDEKQKEMEKSESDQPGSVWPAIQSLTGGRAPAPEVKYSIIDLLFSYALITRVYNGEYLDGSASLLVSVSPCLSDGKVYSSVEHVVHSLFERCLHPSISLPVTISATTAEHGGSGGGGNVDKPKLEFCRALLHDVSMILRSLLRVRVALYDIYLLLREGKRKEKKKVWFHLVYCSQVCMGDGEIEDMKNELEHRLDADMDM